MSNIDFTIAFICHNEIDLYKETLKQNIKSLCKNTKEIYDLVLVIDGAESVDILPLLELADRSNINEVRIRYRNSNCATGDPSNNAHYHLFSDKTRFLLTLEGDVAMFNNSEKFDVLNEIRQLFDEYQQLNLATIISDHDCWKWKLKEVGQRFEEGVLSVNRVSSHCLIYDTYRCRQYINNTTIDLDLFFDDNDGWFNYEDYLSELFAYPNGPGIGFISKFPVKVYHCDEKKEKESPYYVKDTLNKLRIFHTRRSQS